MRDYTAKEVFVGIDVHKKSYSIVCVCEGMIVKKWSTLAQPKELIEQLNRFFKGAILHSVYEAGFSGFILHRALVKQGIDNIVIDPGSIEKAPNDRVKTDKLDAKKLALKLSHQGDLQGIYIPTEQEEQDRLLTRLRATLVRDRAKVVNRIKSKLHQFGLIKPTEKNKQASKQWILKLQAMSLQPELSYVIEIFCNQCLELTSQIREIELKLKRQAEKEGETRRDEIYRSAPGIGKTSARVLSNELGSLERFGNMSKLYSYTGLTPTEASSGEKRKQGGISHCGASRLRHILVEVAWRAIEQDMGLLKKFDEIAKRSSKQTAIVAIARCLIGRIKGCFRYNQTYQSRYELSA